MKRKVFCIALFFFAMLIPCICLADDIAMYSNTNVKPNVLIIFDNSGSMADPPPYNGSYTYSCTSGQTCYTAASCYEYTCITKSKHGLCTQSGWVSYSCPTGSNLTTINTNGCIDTNPDTVTGNICSGNYLNYAVGPMTMEKITAAKNAINGVITASENYSRFGVMVLNAGFNINNYSNPTKANLISYQTDNTVLSSKYGGALIQDRDTTGGTSDTNSIAYLESQINNTTANGGTPLANRLIQAANYFRGQFPNPSGGTYASPIDQTNWCRQNFVIIITDGQPECEGDSLSATTKGQFSNIEGWLTTNAGCTDCDNDGADPDNLSVYFGSSAVAFENGGSHYLDDIAYYLYHTYDTLDLNHNVNQNQNLTIYTIGFTASNPLSTGVGNSNTAGKIAAEGTQLLQHTAANAGGTYYDAEDPYGLSDALNSVMETIIEQTQIFTAPVVPVQKSVSGNYMYISLFTPQSFANFWPGYLIKLYIGSDGNLYGSDQTTRATDAQDNLLLTNLLNIGGPQPQPYWEAQNKLLVTTLSARNIYTYTGSSVHLNASSNSFVTTNTSITSTMLGTPAKQPTAASTTTAQYDLMQYIRGYDSYNQTGKGNYTATRQYVLGDIIHSKPILINYATSGQVVYVGTNSDGMLHAINDTDGTERWAFIPPDLLPKLKNIVEGTSHQYYVDSSPEAYIYNKDGTGVINPANGDKVIVIFGEREGGTSYTALDVTNPNDPQYLWRIDDANATVTGIPNPTTVISELGQSWSEPQIGQVKTSSTDTGTMVAFIGGGYSSATPSTSTTVGGLGRGLFIVNVLTGALVEHYTYSDKTTYSVLTNMTYSIPSTTLAVDTTFDGYIKRVYVGDLGGQMWRFGNQNGTEDGNVANWTPRRLFQGASGTMIYYPPDLVLQPGYAYFYFGTGDRMNPMTIESYIDRLYAVKDENWTDAAFNSSFGGVLTEANLVDVTSDTLQVTGTSQSTINSIQSQLNTEYGWFIQLSNSGTNDGEKVLAPPVVISGDCIFTTFTPNTAVCSYGGTASIYAVNYLNGESVWNLDTTNKTGVLGKSDRSEVVGTGIPTEPVIVIGTNGIARVYVASGGAVVLMNQSPGNEGFNFTSWRELF
jgi:type IV pilus assembly protein PilY1